MKKFSVLVKQVLMSTLTAGIFAFSFSSCSDDMDLEPAPINPDAEMSSMTRAGASGYNINKHRVIYGSDQKIAEPFNTKEWQKEEAIFCYVGSKNGDDNILDENGKKLSGFKLVNLPWASTGASENIPDRIYNEMKNCSAGSPENNPWKLVLMNCGAENVANGNFLGFYNQLTGVLRMLVYIPEDVDAKGSTHMWGALLNDKMANHSLFRYGVPADRNITSKDAKDKLNQSGDMAQIISPWKDGNFSGFNGSPLSPGWWAFDMDFSLYRGNEHFSSLRDGDNVLTFKALSKTEEIVTLDSKMKAKLDGSMKLEASQASTSSGIFGPLEDVLGKANAVADLVDVAKSVVDPNPLKAIENGIKLAKGACDLAGIDYGAETTGFNGYQGNINLALDGTIDTKGIITKQENVAGIFPISFKKGDFIMDNCSTFGEGVWNLKSSPVVYYTNASVDWRYTHEGNNICYWNDKKSPFGGQDNNRKATAAPYTGQVCYFDPSSIQLELNDKLFTKNEIQNAKVYATCGVRKGMKFGDTETYRDAIGLTRSQIKFNAPHYYTNRPITEAPFDALSSHKDKMGLETGTKFEDNTYGGKKYGVFGRGDADYLIEPQALCGGGATRMMPAYEVTVTVIVTRDNGQKIVYNRTYLPEYKDMRIEDMPEINNDYIKDHMPTNYAPEVYKAQINHVNDIRNWTRRCLHPTNGTPSHQYVWLDRHDTGGCFDANKSTYESLTESFATLFDNDLSNRWVSSYKNMCYDVRCIAKLVHDYYVISGRSVIKNNGWSNHPCWFAEFKTNLPSNPTSYSLIASNNASKIGGCNPRVWAMYGKKNPNDEWTLLAMSSYNNQPEDMIPKKSNESTRKIPFRFHDAKGMQYYRFEVLDVADENLMVLGEIRFNYD